MMRTIAWLRETHTKYERIIHEDQTEIEKTIKSARFCLKVTPELLSNFGIPCLDIKPVWRANFASSFSLKDFHQLGATFDPDVQDQFA